MDEWCYICYGAECTCQESISTQEFKQDTQELKRETGQYPVKPYHSPTTSYTYVPWRPYDGVDRNRWPNTWMCLVRLYNSPDWHKMVKYVYIKT